MLKRTKSSLTQGKEQQVSRRAFLRQALGAGTAAAVLPLLAACGQSAPTTPASATSSAAAPAATSGAAAPASAPATGVELTFLNSSRAQDATIKALAETYTKQTGVKVTIDTPGPNEFLRLLQAKSQSGDMPDMFSTTGGLATMAPYYKAGWAMNLTQELDQGWNKNFAPVVPKLTTWQEGNAQGVPPGIYSAHWAVSTYAFLANPDHFKKAGLDLANPPATTADFIEQLKKIKAAGIAPFLVATQYVPQLVQSHVSNWLTDEEIDATFAGKAPWKADAWRKALQLLVDLRDAGVIANNALASDNPEGEKVFFNERSLATYWDGSFSVGVGRSTAPDFTTFTAIPLPKAPDGKLEPRTVGAVSLGGVINPKGKNVAEALKFIKWLTEPAQEQVFMEQVPTIPANPAALDPQKISPQLAGFAALVDKSQIVPTPLKMQVTEALTKGVQSLILKEKTVDEILDDMDAAQRSS